MSEPQALIAGRYRLVHLVGSGGMGEVWEAWDERLERRVALKQLHHQSGLSGSDAELANLRAMREARITARLHHPHAVPVFDVVEHEGQACLIMQFIPSMTLSAVLAEGGPLEPDEAAQVGAQIAGALATAHALGIVHRDVKPGNILIAEDGAALISDFGISRALGDATLTTSGMVHGTPAFLAPEVARGEASDFASDVFSLGATLYAALEGTPPFGNNENSIALLHRVAAGQIEPPQRTGALTPVIVQMLSPEPESRPPMHAVAHTFAQLAAAGGGNARSNISEPRAAACRAPGPPRGGGCHKIRNRRARRQCRGRSRSTAGNDRQQPKISNRRPRRRCCQRRSRTRSTADDDRRQPKISNRRPRRCCQHRSRARSSADDDRGQRCPEPAGHSVRGWANRTPTATAVSDRGGGGCAGRRPGCRDSDCRHAARPRSGRGSPGRQ